MKIEDNEEAEENENYSMNKQKICPIENGYKKKNNKRN